MKTYLRITLSYLVFGVVWIFVTDRFLVPLARDVGDLTEWQTLKGLLYVLVSGAFIYFLTKRASHQEEMAEQRRMEEFKRTVKNSHHILLNYFNQMQILIFEAERSSDFDKSLIEVAKEVTEEAAGEVRKLEDESPRQPGPGPRSRF